MYRTGIRKIIRIIGVLSLSFMCIVLSGCKENETAVRQEKVQLKFFNRKREIYAIMDQIISDFNRSQDKIEVTHIMNSDVEFDLRTMAVKGEFPDLVGLSGLQSTEPTEYLIGGCLLPLDDMDFVKRIEPEYLSYLTYNDHIYHMPLALSFEGIYINKALFREENLEIPDSYESLLETCRIIQERGKVPFIFADQEGWTVHQNWESIQCADASCYGDIFEEVARGESTFGDNPVSRKAMDKLLELHHYTDEANSSLSYDAAMNRFAKGKAFMFMQGSWAYQNIMAQNPHMELELIPFPAEEGKEQYITFWFDSCIGIAKDCEHPEEARQFLEYLASPEVLNQYLEKECTLGGFTDVNQQIFYAPVVQQLKEKGFFKMDATWLPTPCRIIRDIDIADLMPDADEDTVDQYLDKFSKSLRRHKDIFLDVKEKIG